MLLRTAASALFLTLFFVPRLYAQDLSNKGKDFWVVYAGHFDGTTSRMALYITSDQNASGTVAVNGSTIPFTVSANTVTTVQLTNSSSPSNAVAYNAQTEGIGVNKGIHITSDKAVAVYAHILNAARSGSTLVLPTNVLGKDYYVSSYKSVVTGATRRSQFDVIATIDNTTIQITPTGADATGVHPANVPFQVTLAKGDVYQFQSDADLTGTSIKSVGTATGSCQPIAVFSGSTFTAMGCTGASSGDNLYQQLFPTAAWGKTYYTAPFISRSYDIFRVLVQDPAEPVLVNGVALNPATLVSGRFYEFNTQGNNTPRIITSNQPISVFQYLITSNCDGVNSDPEMVALNPVEQTLNDITVMSARADLTPPSTNITKHYLNIIFKTAAFSSLQIDGTAPTAVPATITGTQYSYIQQDVTSSTAVNPAHRIVSDSGFICIAYGYGSVESYGYNAGSNIKDLYQFISIDNEYATVSFPAACRNSPFHFAMTFPYEPTQIQWQFNGLFTDVTINNPAYDSSWVVNGRQLYRYRLPAPYSVSTPGTYPIKVLAQNPTSDGCGGVQEISYDLQVFERPVAGFTIGTNGCVSDAVQFTNTSVTNGRPAYSWSWQFGDGGTASTSNATHSYAVADTFTVSYSIITDIGCLSDTATKQLILTPTPVARFGFSPPACGGHAVTFTDTSTASGSTLVKWTWDFGDGSMPVIATTGMPQQHSYAVPNTYTVTLTVQNENGCQSLLASHSITIHPNPVPAFTMGGGCLPAAAINFTNASTIADGTQAGFAYTWRFGDGATSALPNPQHTYTSAGPFSARLVVTSAAGCADSITLAVTTIYSQPVAVFVPSVPEVCLGGSVNFTESSTVASGTVTQWRWLFGDNTTSALQNPSHTYAVAGTDSVKLVAVSDRGCPSDTARQAIIVNPLPVASFNVSSPSCETRALTFTDISLPLAGTIVQWSWDLGNGTTFVSSNNTPFTHSYATAGLYPASLQVQTNKGCLSTVANNPLTVNPLPRPGFAMPGNCLTDPFTQFTDTSSIPGGGGFTYLWNFGDPNATPGNPNTSTQQHPQHKYTAIDNYNVRLTVTSAAGCTTFIEQTFTINGTTPQAGFSFAANPACSNDSVKLLNLSSVDFGAIVKLDIFWDDANDPSNRSTIVFPAPGGTIAHLYPEFFTPVSKTYRVRVIAYSGDNCFSTFSQTIVVKATPQLQFSPIPSLCADVTPFSITQASVLNALPGVGVFSGPGVSSSGTFTPASATLGTDTLRYVFTGTNGCINTVSQAITVFPVPTADAGPDRLILAGGQGSLLATATGNAVTLLWNPATWLSDATIPTPLVTPLDDITYTLTVLSADGCTATDVVFVRVLKAPTVPNVFTPNGDGVNDTWEIQYLESYPGATVEVYNRYGQAVFQSAGYPRAWDGTYGGKPLPVGTYYYIINPRNGRKQVAGFVDLLR
jgi:gliding motility-associated-like protein